MLTDRDFPALPEALDGLDDLVVVNDLFAADAGVLSAVRAWLHGGGHLWIMLDCVEFAGVERLLGDVFACTLVDRVELDQVDIVPVEGRPSVTYASGESYDQPVAMTRVLVTGMQVTHTVDGWPAAFGCPVGRGRVVFTTVGAKAWIRRAQARRTRWDPDRMTDFEPKPELDELPLIEHRSRWPLEAPTFAPYLAEQIGYRIVPRGLVAAVLGFFCVALLLAGAVLARQRRLEHLGWLAPGAAVLAALPLLGIGLQSKRQVPRTVGQVQIVEVGEHASQMTAAGYLAFYNPSSPQEVLESRGGGILEPDQEALRGLTRRMVWTDLDHWHWENLRRPSGQQHVVFRRSVALTDTIEARGAFTATGFAGSVTGPVASLADAVIVVPGQPCLAVQTEGAELKAGPSSVLPAGQFVAATLLSDEQRRRTLICEQLLPELARNRGATARPMLIGWTPPWDMGFPLPAGVEQVGAALWVIPLQLEPPEAGRRVTIPSPFVRYGLVKGPKGEAEPPIYDHRSGEWITSRSASKLWLRFQIPKEVLPFRAERARLALQITAPDRSVEIVRCADGQYVSLWRTENPIAPIVLSLDNGSLPAVDDTGGLLLGILVSPPRQPGTSGAEPVWKIDRLQLEVAGGAGSVEGGSDE
jgi:hypothetical protein